MNQNKLDLRQKPTPKLCFIFSGIALLISFYIEFIVVEPFIVLKAPIFLDGVPLFTPPHLIRTFCLLLSSFYFVLGFTQLYTHNLQKQSENLKPELTNFNNKNNQNNSFNSVLFWQRMVIWFILAISTLFMIIFVQNPQLFYDLGNEDNLIEYFSCIFSLLASIFCLITLIKLSKNLRINNLLYLIILGFLALLFWLIGMEEISWGQRLFSFDTPDLFTEYGNSQNEMNIHNFANNITEYFYYLVAFLLLILFPFLKNSLGDNISFFAKYKQLDLNNLVSFFTPSIFVFYGSAIFTAYNYDMWNNFLIQLSFFITLFILLRYAYDYGFKANILPVFFLIMFIANQAVFLGLGHNFVREWDVTEYKEFFIPLGFVLYSFELLHKSKKIIIRKT